MTNEEIKKIVDDERVEQLTVQACHHWEIATQRLEELTKYDCVSLFLGIIP